MRLVSKATVDTALFSYLAVVLMSPLVTECATGIESSLLTGLEIGTLNCKVAITGTRVNPVNFKRRFEAISALLSLFDIQEKINNQIESASLGGSGSGLDPPHPTAQIEDNNMGLTDMQILLESVIQDSCAYVNWTLSDFFFRIPGYGCDGVTQQSLSNCSREAAESLQLKLNLWMAHRNAHHNLKTFSCYEQKRCSTVARTHWVAGLKLNTSDPVEAQTQRYLDCII